MKRKRGKKGKLKKVPVVGVEEMVDDFNPSTEVNSGPEETVKDETDSKMDVETPVSTGIDQPEKPATVGSDGPVDKPAGKLVYNRVKVKIKSSKALESQITSSDAHTHSDTDKSSQHVGLDKQGVVSDKVEDSANSMPEVNRTVSVYQSKKAGSIKIKSRGLSSSSLSPCNNTGLAHIETIPQKEPELPRPDYQYNKQELNTALEVIKKIMKMDAAEPFNMPVNPVALGIPDYFDVIDTPMDFGTICNNLETGTKYKNSEDVFKDVQYIWDNCYKYNNKGDYVLELMKRVKKNFSKYWSAAGLYGELQSTSGGESIQPKDVTPSSHGKTPIKGCLLKNKIRKRHGVKRHKDDCLCAICVMMRRRQEREENEKNADEMETSDGHLAQEPKQEGTSIAESPEVSSSSMGNSQDQGADTELEDKGEAAKLENSKLPHSNILEKQVEQQKENEIAFSNKEEGEISEHSQLGGRSREEHGKDYEVQTVESGNDIQKNANIETSERPDDETTAVEHHKPKEWLNKREKAKIYESLHRRFENPVLLELCGSLFAETPKSSWSGPHSLVQHQASSRCSSIHSAMATFRKYK